MNKINCLEYFNIELKKLTQTNLVKTIKQRQSELKKSIENNDLSSKIIKVIEKKVEDRGIKIEDKPQLFAKLIKDDLFAMFFFSNENISEQEKKDIVKQYFKEIQNKPLKENEEVMLVLSSMFSARAGNAKIEEHISLAKKNKNKKFYVLKDKTINSKWMETYKKLITLNNIIEIDN